MSNLAAPMITDRDSKNEEVPNFLIIGAPKSGTTSLYNWLQDSEDVFMPADKEPSFFMHYYGYADWESYLSLFKGSACAKMRGEASAGYLAAPESAKMIYEKIPDVKMIVLLRNPVNRAYSCWAWMAMEGYENASTFEQALDLERSRNENLDFKRQCPAYFMDYFYRQGGLYAAQLEKFFELFSREKILILLFEDLVREPERIYRLTCEFLGINPNKHLDSSARNISRLPRFIKIQYALRQIMLKSQSSYYRPFVDRIFRMNLDFGTKPPELKEKTRQNLQSYYEEPNKYLAKLVALDLSAWLK